MQLSYVIIQVLKKYSSEKKTKFTSPLTQNQITNYIKKDFPNFSEDITPKKVRDSLAAVIKQEESWDDKDKTIRYTVSNRGNREYKNNYWTPNAISDIELKFLIDSVMYSSIFNTPIAHDLAKRIQGISGKSLKNLTPYINDSFGKLRFTGSTDVLNNVEQIMSAEGRKIAFDWNPYKVVDNKIKSSLDKRCIVYPLNIILNNGRYFLFARYIGSPKIYTFSVDLMTNIAITDDQNSDGIKLSDYANDFKRAQYALEHPFMMGGETIKFKLRVNKEYLSRVVDDFSYGISISHSTPFTDNSDTVDIWINASKEGMKYWLLHHYDIAVALNMDDDFKQEMQEAVKVLYKNYIKKD